MTDEEEQIAFNQWLKDWDEHFRGMPKSSLLYVYRSMDEANRQEFLEEARRHQNDI